MAFSGFDEHEEDEAPKIQSLTDFANEDYEQEQQKKKVIIECAPTTFRKFNGYLPEVLRPAQASQDGRHSTSVVERLDRDDEEALHELLNGSRVTNHIIASTGDNDFANKIKDAAASNTLEDYETIPLDSFGLAMLRGMGHDPEVEAAKTKAAVKKQVRRPEFLALGASERPADSKSAEELRKKPHEKRMEDRRYVPVIKVQKLGTKLSGSQALISPDIGNGYGMPSNERKSSARDGRDRSTSRHSHRKAKQEDDGRRRSRNDRHRSTRRRSRSVSPISDYEVGHRYRDSSSRHKSSGHHRERRHKSRSPERDSRHRHRR